MADSPGRPVLAEQRLAEKSAVVDAGPTSAPSTGRNNCLSEAKAPRYRALFLPAAVLAANPQVPSAGS
ncbi:MAG TPA: hypothetical protein VLL08_29595 [Kineosporiaceae bacterium]|nr:hypothetical protein [Kineosporiaceae bacterium]